MAVNTRLPRGEALPEPAMAGSAREEARGERRARTGRETHCPEHDGPQRPLRPSLLADKGRTQTGTTISFTGSSLTFFTTCVLTSQQVSVNA